MPWGYAAAAAGTYLSSRSAGRSSERSTNAEFQGQREALDYQREVEALPLEIRNQFLPMLSDFYSGGEGQNQLISDVKSSPFYGQMVQAGQEGVLANAGAMGLSRSGNTAQDLSQSNQGVLQNLVDQRLMGMSSLAQQPMNTNAIASSMQGIGQTRGQGIQAQGQIQQNMFGQLLNSGMGAGQSAGWWG